MEINDPEFTALFDRVETLAKELLAGRESLSDQALIAGAFLLAGGRVFEAMGGRAFAADRFTDAALRYSQAAPAPGAGSERRH